MGTATASFEETIEKLEQTRRMLDRDRMEAARQLRQAEEEQKKAGAAPAELEVRLEKAEDKARREAQRILEEARAVSEDTFRELDRMRSQRNEEADHQRVNEARAAMRRRINEARQALERPEEEPEERTSARPVKAGDMVLVRAMGVKAQVESVSADRVLALRAGAMRITVREDEVLLLENERPAPVRATGYTGPGLQAAGVSPELDIRGMETLEAVPVVERYIDSAAQGKLETVTVIHGKGTGALRAAVQQALKKHPRVKSFRLGRYGEGETGVTVVELK